MARIETGLTNQRGLLISKNARDCHTLQRSFVDVTVNLAAGANLRQHGWRNTECVKNLLVPRQRVEVHQLSAAGVGYVCGVNAAIGAAGEVPEQEGVNVSKKHVARVGERTNAGNILQQPANLESAEVCRERETGLGAETVLPAGFLELRHIVCNAGVLPDQRVCHGFPCFAIPQDGSFALIGNSDRRQLRWLQSAFLHRLGDHFLGAPPDFFRIVFHPSGLGINLFMLFLRDRDHPAGAVKHDEARAGCALIDGANVLCHNSPRRRPLVYWLGKLELGQLLLSERNRICRGRVVRYRRGCLAVILRGFVFVAQLFVGLADHALDEWVVLVGLC